MNAIRKWFRAQSPEEAIGIFFACLIWIAIIFGLSSVAFGASPAYEESFVLDVNSGVGPFTDSLTVACADDLVMVVGVYLDTDRFVDSIYYDGEALSYLFSGFSSEGDNVVEHWILANPTCGSAEDFVLDHSATGDVRTVISVYSGVDQTAVYDTFGQDDRVSGTDPISVFMTNTESDDTIVFFVAGAGTLTSDNATIRATDSTAPVLRVSMFDRTVSGNGGFTSTFNDGNVFGMYGGGIALIGSGSSTPVVPSATSTIATTTLEFVSENMFRVLLIFFISLSLALWIARLFLR